MSQESIKNPHTSDVNFALKTIWDYQIRKVKFRGICFKQDTVSFLHKKVVYLYIFLCELDSWSNDLNTCFILGYCLFGAVKLIKKADPDKYNYSGYGIGFDSCSEFSWTDGSIEGPTKDLDNEKLNILLILQNKEKDLY